MRLISEEDFFKGKDLFIDSQSSYLNNINDNFDDYSNLDSDFYDSFSNLTNDYSPFSNSNSFDDYSSYLNTWLYDNNFNYHSNLNTKPNNLNTQTVEVENTNDSIDTYEEVNKPSINCDTSSIDNSNIDNSDNNLDNCDTCIKCDTNLKEDVSTPIIKPSNKKKSKTKDFILDSTKCSTIPIPIISNNILGSVNPIHLLSLSLKNNNFYNVKTLLSFNCLITSISTTSLSLMFILKKYNNYGYSIDLGNFYYNDVLEFSGTNSFSFQVFDLNNDLAFFDNIYYSVEVIPINPILTLGSSINNCSLSLLGINTM